jgi:hypothetical protein
VIDLEQSIDHFEAVFGEPRPAREAAIVSFMREFREVAKSKPQITERHLQFVETMLTLLHEAAGENGPLMDLWDSVRALISDTSKSVKERLAGLDPLGDRWNEYHHGRPN